MPLGIVFSWMLLPPGSKDSGDHALTNGGLGCSNPVLSCAEGHAESSQGPMSAPAGQQEGPGFRFMTGLPQKPGQLLCIPAPWLGTCQEVLDEPRVEGGGDALHQQFGIQEQ